MKNTMDLGSGKIWPMLFKLTIPSMLAQFVNVMYSIVDRIFISQIPEIGNLALAGVGVCAPIITLIVSFCYLMGLGGAPLVSIKLGEGNKEEAQRIMANSFIGLLSISFIIMAVVFPLKSPMLKIFGASDNIFKYANQYLTTYLFGTVFSILSLGLNVFITCQGRSGIAMCSVLVSAILNIILDPILIFTCNMGVRGGAIATVISQAVSCFWIVGFLLSKKSVVKLSFKGFSFKTTGKIMLLGLSPFFIMATDGAIIIALNSMLQKFGGAQGDLYVAAGTVVVSFMQIISFPLGGITMGAQPLLSYNYGAQKLDRVKQSFIRLIVLCLGFCLIMFILAMSIPQYFARIFTNDTEILAIAITGIRKYTAGVLLMAVQYACVDTFTALGQPRYAISLSMFRKIGIMLPLTILLPMLFGAGATFWCESLADIIGGLTSGIVFLISFRRILAKRGSKVQH